VVACLLASQASAAVIAEYNFTSIVAGPPQSSASVDTFDDSQVVTSSIVSSGVNLTGGQARLAGNLVGNSESAALTDNKYLEFTVTPQSGYQVDLTSLTFDLLHQSGTANLSVFTSINGFTAGNAAGSASTTSTTYVGQSIDLSALSTQTSAITIRLYPWDLGNNTNQIRLDNVVLNAEVSPIPEPASLALIAAGGVLMLPRRRKA
jgi:hypothetical protein